MNFDQAFKSIIGDEGGFQKDPIDDGNWTSGVAGHGELKGTKYGISAASYPRLDIENITLEKAKEIYLLDYWNGCGCDLVPYPLGYLIFDYAANSGKDHAIKAIQSALHITVDGAYGDQTRTAMRAAGLSPEVTGRLYRYLSGDRLEVITKAGDAKWVRFGRGWVKRIARFLKA